MDNYEELESVVLRLRSEILDGLLNPGQIMPSAEQMALEKAVNPDSVRIAYAALILEGFLSRDSFGNLIVAEHQAGRPIVALVLPHLRCDWHDDDMFASDVIIPLTTSIEDEARRLNITISLKLDNESIEREKENLFGAVAQKLDGMIVFPITTNKNLKVFQEIDDSGFPLVFIDRHFENLDVDFVESDNYQAAFDAVRLLSQKGYERILYLTSEAEISSLVNRTKGVLDSSRYGAHVTTRILSWESSFKVNEISDIVCKFLISSQCKAAIFADSPRMANGVISGVKRSGLDLDNLAYACFDNVPSCEQLNCLKLMIKQPLDQVGKVAVRVVNSRIKGDPGPNHVYIKPEIQIIDPS